MYLPVYDFQWVQVHRVSAFPLASLSLKGSSQPAVCLLNAVHGGSRGPSPALGGEMLMDT